MNEQSDPDFSYLLFRPDGSLDIPDEWLQEEKLKNLTQHLSDDINFNYSDFLNFTKHFIRGGNNKKLLINNTSSDLHDVESLEVLIILSLFYGIISFVAVVGNALVIWIIATSKNFHTVTNYFIANLALADITIGLFSIPFQVRINSFVLSILQYFYESRTKFI